MVTHFEISTSFILERLKDLETDSFGNRPQTAAVLSKIGTPRPTNHAQKTEAERKTCGATARKSTRPAYAQTAASPCRPRRCPSTSFSATSKRLPSPPAWSLTFPLRNSTKCKICGEVMPKEKSAKKAHLAKWRSLEVRSSERALLRFRKLKWPC